MSQIRDCFARLKQHNRSALMPFLTMGYPYKEAVLDLVPNLIAAGADLLELGIPFSDPLADGQVIQASSAAALKNNMSLKLALEQISYLRKADTTVPMIIMCYYNPIIQYGISKFVGDCHKSSVAAVIVPDLPPESADFLQNELRKVHIDLIFLLAPNSTEERIKIVTAKASGFIYLVSVLGVTGARNSVATNLPAFINRVRKHTDLPLVVGFGISTPEQVREISKIADGIIIGSALINKLSTQDKNDYSYRDFISSLKQAITS